MISFRKFIDFLVNEYIFLALIISSFTLFIFESIAFSPNLYYILALASGTFLLYKYISPFKSVNQLLTKNGLFLGITSSLLFLLFLLILSTKSLLFLGLAGILSLLYFFGWPPIIKPMRAYLLLKPFTIGLVYSILVCQIPMIESHYVAHEYIYSMGAVFLFVSALAIVFDLGDVEEDDVIATFPKTIGIVPSKIMVTLLMICASAAMYYSAWTYLISIPESVAFGLSCLTGIIIGWRATSFQPKSFYLTYVDGVMALPYVFTMFFRLI